MDTGELVEASAFKNSNNVSIPKMYKINNVNNISNKPVKKIN
jgi:hypothetical protein